MEVANRGYSNRTRDEFTTHLRRIVDRILSIPPIERNPGMKQLFSWHVHGDRKFEVAPRSRCREISLGGRLLEREQSQY